MVYSIHYVPHPWDKEARQRGVNAFCLCREVRLPVEDGNVRGRQVSWEPVALFNFDSEALLFEEFCYSEIPVEAIEVRPEFMEMKRELELIRGNVAKRYSSP